MGHASSRLDLGTVLDRPRGFWLLEGAVGAGKTHWLVELAESGRRRGLRVVTTTTVALVEGLVDAIERDTFGRWRRGLAACDLLLVDDAHVLAARPVTEETLAEVLSEISRRGGRVVVAGTDAAELPTIGGLAEVVQLGDLERRQRIRLVRVEAARRGLDLSFSETRELTDVGAGSPDLRPVLGALNRLSLARRASAAD